MRRAGLVGFAAGVGLGAWMAYQRSQQYAVFIGAHGVSLWKMRRTPLYWSKPRPMVNQAPAMVAYKRRGGPKDETFIYEELTDEIQEREG